MVDIIAGIILLIGVFGCGWLMWDDACWKDKQKKKPEKKNNLIKSININKADLKNGEYFIKKRELKLGSGELKLPKLTPEVIALLKDQWANTHNGPDMKINVKMPETQEEMDKITDKISESISAATIEATEMANKADGIDPTEGDPNAIEKSEKLEALKKSIKETNKKKRDIIIIEDEKVISGIDMAAEGTESQSIDATDNINSTVPPEAGHMQKTQRQYEPKVDPEICEECGTGRGVSEYYRENKGIKYVRNLCQKCGKKARNLKPYRRPAPKIGRNEPCNCGSGKKYKKCCGG